MLGDFTVPEVAQPTYPIDLPMMVGSFLPRIMRKVSQPITEPLKATALSIQAKLMPSDEDKIEYFLSQVMKQEISFSHLEEQKSKFVYN